MSKAGESILRGAREALAYARGNEKDFVAHVPQTVDVRAIRKHVGLSQAKFAARFGFSLDAIRNWEQGRRLPDVAARAFLMVIEREPDVVMQVLSEPEGKAGKSHVARSLHASTA